MRIDSKARDRANGFTPVLATSLSALVLATGAMYAEPAQAVSVCVRVASYRAPMPDGTTARMWGYQVAPNPGNTIDCNQAASGSVINQAVTSPGDAITVPANDTTLTVTLINRVSANPGVVNTNGETALAVPTSFVLQGHNATMVPVFKNAAGNDCTPGGTATDLAALQAIRECRVRSFTHETSPGQRAVYTYSNVKPGTYMYQSGTMPQIQVQMGLYGMVRRNAADGTPANAYASLPFDNQISLLLSEVDPAIHTEADAGTFNRSTIGYDPKYFRLHRYDPPGAACSTGTPATCISQPTDFTEASARNPLTIQPGRRQLVRVVNAGLQSRALELIDGHWYLVAEDGNKFPYPREQYSALLPAAKTADFWFTPTIGDDTSTVGRQLTIFDRRMALTNNNADPTGGQLIRLNIQNVTGQPVVNVSSCATGPTGVTQGSLYSCTVTATNATTPTFALEIAPAGMTIDATSGAIAWTPTNEQARRPAAPTLSNPVQVRVTGANGRSDTGSFSVAVTNTPDAPVAANDAIGVRGGTATFAIASLLSNDSDPDGDALTGFANSPSSAGMLTNNGNGTLTFTEAVPASTVPRTFTYTVTDGALTSNAATVTLTVYANSAPTALNDIATVTASPTWPLLIDVLANDSDIDGNLNPSSLAIVGAPNQKGTAFVVSAGCPAARPCISYAPAMGFRGSETITYTVSDQALAKSSPATVTVNIP